MGGEGRKLNCHGSRHTIGGGEAGGGSNWGRKSTGGRRKGCGRQDIQGGRSLVKWEKNFATLCNILQ